MIQDPTLTEQFQEQGLEILKSIREGSPEAFAMILNEVSRYSLFVGSVQTALGIISCVVAGKLFHWALTREWNLGYTHHNDRDDAKLTLLIIACIFLAIISPIALVHGTDNLSVGISPLGWLVTHMVK